ncbi:MAG: hypothetical protein QM500_04700 [Methylococcales bacterium]
MGEYKDDMALNDCLDKLEKLYMNEEQGGRKCHNERSASGGGRGYQRIRQAIQDYPIMPFDYE